MSSIDELRDFVRQALAAGQDRQVIGDALQKAGWTSKEVSDALDGWLDGQGGLPPVPRPGRTLLVKEVFFYGLLFISLSMLSWHLIWLCFSIIDMLIEDPYGRPASPSSMRWPIAVLIVFLPLFLFLNRRGWQGRDFDRAGRELRARSGFASITLLVSSLVLIGDMIALIFALLNGDLSIRFAAKALVVAAVGGLILLYYRNEDHV